MVRKKRRDGPGIWHHITNRGIARRPLFLCVGDIRYFLSCVAREVRRGTLQVFSYSLLMTHFHMLGCSPDGDMPSAMMRVEQRYSRYANRRLRRDGPLMRGRFASKPVTTHPYKMAVVRYIDFNPVQAGLVKHPWDYPHGSAAAYVHGLRQPWLSRDWVEGQVTDPGEWVDSEPSKLFSGPAYMERFGRLDGDAVSDLVERRMLARRDGPDELDDLFGAAPERVRAWMQRKAALADGSVLGQPLVVPVAVEAALAQWPESLELALKPMRGPTLSVKLVARVGLLRHLAGLSWSEISREVDYGEAKCRRLCDRYNRLSLHEPLFVAAAAEATRKALDMTFGLGGSSRPE